MDKNLKIYIAGHRGMVGSAVWRELTSYGFINLVGRTRSELDLKNQREVNSFFLCERPDIVIDAAAKVGGILANQEHPYGFLMENLQIQNNLIDSSHSTGVKKFIFLGSSCIYPKESPQPIKEEYLMTGPLESTNEWYAIAKIAGIKACDAVRKQYGKDFVSLMPTNLYGSFDNFDLHTSHVLPAMIRKFYEAKDKGLNEVNLWGSGMPKREFLHVDDLAKAVVFAIVNNMPENLYNVGSGKELSIRKLAEKVQKIVGFTGNIVWDSSKPDGTMRKLMDSSKLNALGWKADIELEEGIEKTYAWFLENRTRLKEVEM